MTKQPPGPRTADHRRGRAMTRGLPAEQLSVTRRAGSRRENGASCPDGLLLRLITAAGP